MAVNWDKPVNADAYDTEILPVINEKLDGAAMMDFTGDTNVPVGAIRFNTTTDQFERWSGAVWVEVFGLPTNYIGGLITSNDADATHDVNVAAGECRGLADDANLRLTTEITKQIDAAWAVGDDAGGLDTGNVVALQTYLLWLIKRSDTGVVDAIFSILGLLEQVVTVSAATADDSYNVAVEDLSIFKPGQTIYVEGFTDAANNGLKTVVTSAANKITVSENLADEAAGDTVTITARVTGPIMPANYDKKRLIAAVRTDGAANILSYLQSGDYFRCMGTLATDVSDSVLVSQTYKTAALNIPPQCLSHCYVRHANATTTAIASDVRLRTKGASDNPGTLSQSFLGSGHAGTFDAIAGTGSVLVDVNRQVEYAAPETDGTASITIVSFAFTMLSRREP